MEFSKILVRATNWVGDAVMSLPAVRALRRRFPNSEIVVLAKPAVAGLYARESAINRVIEYPAAGRGAQVVCALGLRRENFDCAILLQNAFEAALIARLAGIPTRIGYNRDARGWLLTHAISVPRPGEIPKHERYYYMELLRRADLIDQLPDLAPILLDGLKTRAGNRIGISPGAAYGTAKRWLPQNFVAAAVKLAQETGASIAVFGSPGERDLCSEVAAGIERSGAEVHNYAGETSLTGFIDLAAGCRAFLSNDSGAMHIASAAGTPTIAVFGATNPEGTGPTGALDCIVREPVECSPCMLRECPIDHRCMTRVTPDRVVEEVLKVIRPAP